MPTDKIRTLKKIAADAVRKATAAAAAESDAIRALDAAHALYVAACKRQSDAIDAVTAAELREERPLGDSDGEAREFSRKY